MRTRSKILVALAVTAALVAGACLASRLLAPARSPLRIYGNVDIRDVSLAFRVGGRLQRVLVDEGDRVQPGQLVAELDPEPTQREIAEGEANVAALAARLALLRAGYRPEDIAQAAAQAEERAAELQNAEEELARETRLSGSGASTVEHFEQAQAAREESRARLAAAQQALAESRRGFRSEEIAEAAANLERARAGLAQARLRLEDTHLLAPSPGVILTRAVEPGAMVGIGTTVLSLSLVQPVWVRAYVKETDLAAAKPGTEVQVRADSLPDRSFRGQVGFVSPTAEFTPKNVETPDLRTELVYRLRIIVDDPQSQLRQGMPVTVELGRAAR
jgi:HlyD family secretion protein